MGCGILWETCENPCDSNEVCRGTTCVPAEDGGIAKDGSIKEGGVIVEDGPMGDGLSHDQTSDTPAFDDGGPFDSTPTEEGVLVDPDGKTCPAPSNDTCTTAEKMVLSGNMASVAGDTLCATKSLSLPAMKCLQHLTPGPDLFYEITLAPGDYTINLKVDGDYDPAVYVLPACGGTCEQGMGIDTQGVGDEKFDINITQTADYIIVVDGYAAAESGSFTLEVSKSVIAVDAGVPVVDAAPLADAPPADAPPVDAPPVDAPPVDAPPVDAPPASVDLNVDSVSPDSNVDANVDSVSPDSNVDANVDSVSPDLTVDTVSPDLSFDVAPPVPDFTLDWGCAIGTPDHCAVCGDVCDGIDGVSTERTCIASQCGIECKGDYYDVNDSANDDCESVDDNNANHSKLDAMLHTDVTDCDAKFSVIGSLPSDKRDHQTAPTSRLNGLPDWYEVHISDTGCAMQVNVEADLANLPASAQYQVDMEFVCENGNGTVIKETKTASGGTFFTLNPFFDCLGTVNDTGTLYYTIKKVSGSHSASDYTLWVTP
jgi:hypothetical protein